MMTTQLDGRQGRNRILGALGPAELALLSPYLTNSHLKQGVMLQEAGEAIEHVYFPQSGMISLLAVMGTGVGVETATVGREGAVGVMAGLWGHPSATGRAVIQLAGDFAHIPAAQFRAAFSESSVIRDLIMRYNDAQVMLVYQVAGCNALHQGIARLCRRLLQTWDRSDSDKLPLTHKFLSQMLGVQRTTVTTLARELQDLGLVNYRRGRIEIIDRPGLEKRTCECYETGRRKIDEVFSEARA